MSDPDLPPDLDPRSPREPDRAPRRRRWWDMPGAGRPELHWRIVRALTLTFSIVVLAGFVGYAMLVVTLLVALSSGASIMGSNK
jgi:hypothetical protein